MKKIFSVLAVSLVIIALPVVAFAAEFRAAGQNGSIDLPKGETAKNLYIAGNTVNVSGISNGDLIAAGNTLNLTGPVEDSLLAAGNTINLSGVVNKSARLAGSSVNITNNIQEDLLVGGATLTVSPDTTIGGDLIAGIGTLTLNGSVNGGVKVSGGDITINSKINGDVTVYDANTLILGDKANIGGNLTYRSPKEAQISKSAVVSGKTDFTKSQPKSFNNAYLAGALGVFGFIGLLMGLALLFVFVYVLPRSSRTLVENTLNAFWTNLGWGFLASVAAPAALIVIAITILGLKLAGILFMLYVGFIAVSAIVATLIIGAQILRWIGEKDYRVDWLTILIGTLAAIVIGLIPIIGGLAIWLISVAVLGQLVKYVGAFLKSQR